MKICLVLMGGYNAITQIVFQYSKNYRLFELAFQNFFFSPYNALNSASLHQGVLQQLASCRQSLTALCSLNIKQHSDLFLPSLGLNSLYIGRLSSSEEEWAKSRTQNCVFRYPDLCFSTVVVLASELWDFYISTGSLDEKSFNFFSPFILSRLVWGHKQAESSHCRQSELLISS